MTMNCAISYIHYLHRGAIAAIKQGMVRHRHYNAYTKVAVIFFYLSCPRPLSDVAYIVFNSKTKRLRKTKLCTGVPQVTCDSHTDFKVKRSKVKVTGRRHIVAAT